MYYNNEQKEKYFENSRFAESTLEVAKRFFDSSRPVENQEGTDLSNFNRPQVISLLKKFNSRSKGYYKMICIVFSDYYNWCLNEGYVDKSNVTNWYENNLSMSIINEIVPIEFMRDKCFSQEDMEVYKENILDPVNKSLAYSIYRGISGVNHEDLKHLQLKDLNEESKTIQLYSGRIQKVDDIFIQLLKKADKMTKYMPDGKDVDNKLGTNDYDESIYVFKICNTKSTDLPMSNAVINTRFKIIRKQADNNYLNGANLYFNGMINYIKEHYSPQGVDLDKVIFQKKNNKNYTYDKETEEVIREFGSNMEVKALRLKLKDIIQFYL